MRRWLIALFACHFLLGVVGFGIPDHIGLAPLASLADDESAKTSLLVAKTQKGMNDLAHALADELPDLPDSLQRRPTALLSHVMTPTRPHAPIAALPRPVLDGPFRPPRQG